MLATPEDKLQNVEETARRARLDIQGVMDADAYVLCTDNTEVGKGMYVEFGAALALNAKTGRPKIYLIGSMNHMSVFYFHPLVTRLDSIDQVLSRLQGAT